MEGSVEMYNLKTSEFEITFQPGIEKRIHVSLEHIHKVLSLEDTMTLSYRGEEKPLIKHDEEGLHLGNRDVISILLNSKGDISSFSYRHQKGSKGHERTNDLVVLDAVDLMKVTVEIAEAEPGDLILFFIEDFDTFFAENKDVYEKLMAYLDDRMALFICD